MLEFMDYIQHAFFRATNWNVDNSYPSLNTTAQSLLDFPTPKGLRINISSLPTPHFSSSYSLTLNGPVAGSIAYLFSSLPLAVPSRSTAVPLASLIRGYRHLLPPQSPEDKSHWEIWHRGRRVDQRDTLLYGRIFLPTSRLEALYLRRTAPERLVQIRGVSDSGLPNGGNVLGIVHTDHGKYSTEYLFSTDSGLLGVRGLYNFGVDPRQTEAPTARKVLSSEVTNGLTPSLFSIGAEVYYGLLNKSAGVSTGLRFTTLPAHSSFPYTMTLTLNPLMGNLSSTYAVKAGRYLALCSRFDFNFYSYESRVMLGCELWRLKSKPNGIVANVEGSPKAATQDDSTNRVIDEIPKPQASISPTSSSILETFRHGFVSQAPKDEDVAGVLKARIDQDWKIGLLWEAKFKELIFSAGTSLDLKRRDRIFCEVGLELQYSS